jgi:hypothetical protein
MFHVAGTHERSSRARESLRGLSIGILLADRAAKRATAADQAGTHPFR